VPVSAAMAPQLVWPAAVWTAALAWQLPDGARPIKPLVDVLVFAEASSRGGDTQTRPPYL
jgi:hypothetical protein